MSDITEAFRAVVREELDRVLVELRAAMQAPAPTRGPTLLRRREYAERVSMSPRTLDRVLDPACFVGMGRRRRVNVALADSYLAASKPADERPAEDSRAPDSDVVVAARRAARGVR